MFKRSLLLGIVSGLLAGIAGLIYAKLFYSTSEANFDTVGVVTNVKIVAGSLIGGVLGAIGYWAAVKVLKGNGEIVFNLLFSILSFASLVGIFGYRLPKASFEYADQFAALVAPMHFFPALAWFTVKPLFFRQR